MYCIEKIGKNLYIGRRDGSANAYTTFEKALKFHDKESAELVMNLLIELELITSDYVVSEHSY